MAVPTTHLYLNARSKILQELNEIPGVMKDKITLNEVSRILGVSKSLLLFRVNKGDLKARKIKGWYYSSVGDIMDFLNILDREARIYDKNYTCNRTQQMINFCNDRKKVLKRLNSLKKGIIDLETASLLLNIPVWRVKEAGQKNQLRTLNTKSGDPFRTTQDFLIEFVDSKLKLIGKGWGY